MQQKRSESITKSISGVLDNKTLSFLNKIGNTTFQGTKKLESVVPIEEVAQDSDLQFTRPLSANSLLALETGNFQNISANHLAEKQQVVTNNSKRSNSAPRPSSASFQRNYKDPNNIAGNSTSPTPQIPASFPNQQSTIIHQQSQQLQQQNLTKLPSASQLSGMNPLSNPKQVLHFKHFHFNPAHQTSNSSTTSTTQDSNVSLQNIQAKKDGKPTKLNITTVPILQMERKKSADSTPRQQVIVKRDNASSGFIFMRSTEERKENPERLNLDRRNLTECPFLDGEEKLKLLNYQYNSIIQIQNLNNLPNLVFLDFYNNSIAKIANLNNLHSLRVLMLGKNKISKIEGLEALKKLDVLDLHSNYIEKIENLSHLKGLRILNLAGNKIRIVEGLDQLSALTEINLRRNEIDQVRDIHELENLQRVFLSNNALKTFEVVETILQSKSIVELSMDNNEVASLSYYRQQVIEKMKNLKQLDMKRISDEERRISEAITKKEEEKLKKDSQTSEKMDTLNVISNLWTKYMDTVDKNDEEQVQSIRMYEEEISNRAFVEVDGNTLICYGDLGAEFVPEKFPISIEVVCFQYIPFEKIASQYLFKLRKFQNLKTLKLQHNYLTNLFDIAKLAQFSAGVQHLIIEENPILKSFHYLKLFLLHVWPHLQTLNGRSLTKEEKQEGENLFLMRSVALKSISKPNNSSNKLNTEITSMVNRYVDSVFAHSFAIDAKMKIIDEEWDKVVEEIIIETIKKPSN